MGTPKQSLKGPDGRTMLDMVLDTARGIASRILVSGPSGLIPHLPHVPDERDDFGPLAGIEAVLKSGLDDLYLFVPCDMPGLTHDALRRLINGLDQSQACLFVHPERHARAMLPLMLRASSLNHLKTFIESGARSLHRFLEDLDVDEVRLESSEAVFLVNINSPSDWKDYLASIIWD